jgi:fatty acid desaturase
LPSFLERIFLAPNNVNYHLEHHLYPSVPFFQLPRLHALLCAKPEFRQAHMTRGYVGVLQECVAEADSLAKGEARPKSRDLVLQASTVAGPG